MYITRQGDASWVAEIEGDEIKSEGFYKYRIIIKSKKFDTNTHYNMTVKTATEEQIAHLKACIKADKFLKWDDSMLETNYEIY